MDRDQIWEEIKNDKSEIYGQSVIDSFLQLTKHINKNHFLELNDKQKSIVSSGAIVDLLLRLDHEGKTEDVDKIAKSLGKKNFNKIEKDQVRHLLSQWQNDENHIFNYILKYKDVDGDDLYYVLISANDSDNLKRILNLISEDQLGYLSSIHIGKLLTDYLNKFGSFGSDEGFEMFKILANKLGENINKLESRHLAWTGRGLGVISKEIIPDSKNIHKKHLEEILEILGPKNLDKLTGGQINMLLDTEDIEYRKKLCLLLGERLNKLSDKVVSAMIYGPFINNLDLYNAVDVADSLGPNRMSKWLQSNESQETIELMKQKANQTSSTAHDWEDNFNAFMKWIKDNIVN